MLFVMYCLDKDNAAALRQANRPKHLEFAHAQPCIKMAGPLLADDGESMVGSLFVIDVPDRAAADDFNQNDPYTKAGLWQSVTTRPFRWLLPAGSAP